MKPGLNLLPSPPPTPLPSTSTSSKQKVLNRDWQPNDHVNQPSTPVRRPQATGPTGTLAALGLRSEQMNEALPGQLGCQRRPGGGAPKPAPSAVLAGLLWDVWAEATHARRRGPVALCPCVCTANVIMPAGCRHKEAIFEKALSATREPQPAATERLPHTQSEEPLSRGAGCRRALLINQGLHSTARNLVMAPRGLGIYSLSKRPEQLPSKLSTGEARMEKAPTPSPRGTIHRSE